MTEPSAPRPVTVRCPICQTLNRVDLARLSQGPRCASCKRPLHFDRPQGVNEADFDTIVGGSAAPVLVDFYADWCGPCKAMAPTLDEFAALHAGEVLVLKLDTDRYPAIATRFGIRGIPTLIAFRGGKESRRHVGMADPAILENLVGAVPA